MAIIEQPTPMYAFTFSSGLAFISAFFLVEKVKEDNEESPKKHEVDQDVTVDATVCPDNDDDYKKVSYWISENLPHNFLIKILKSKHSKNKLKSKFSNNKKQIKKIVLYLNQ